MRRSSWIVIVVVLVVVCLVEAAAILFLRNQASWQAAAAGRPIERGREIAERMGCFGCHGAGGTNPIRNPGAGHGEVPDWSGGTWMMWNEQEEDVRAWIVDGHPPQRAPDANALIPMPAYGDLLSPDQLDDLVAYVLTVAQFGQPEDPEVVRGREIGRRLGCFGCHGSEGRGLIWNPGSMKGYIPGWDSSDYTDLVRDDDEFRQWVRNGICNRLAENPAAGVFLDRQPIQMPAYGDRVTDEQLDALLAYVRWVRDHPRHPSGEQ